MSTAKIAYLTSPAPDRYVFNYQEDGSEDLKQIEISEGHLANIIIDGASFSLRRSINRVPPLQPEEAHERSTSVGT